MATSQPEPQFDVENVTVQLGASGRGIWLEVKDSAPCWLSAGDLEWLIRHPEQLLIRRAP